MWVSNYCYHTFTFTFIQLPLLVSALFTEEAGLLTRLAGLAPSISSAASAEAAHASRAELEAQLRGLDTNVRTRQQQRLQGAAMCDPAGRQWVGATLNVVKDGEGLVA